MASLFERTLSAADGEALFDAPALLHALLEFEAALAGAEADAGVLPASHAEAIAAACDTLVLDAAGIDALVADARHAGTVIVPLVRRLTTAVAAIDPAAAGSVHLGSTSQDAIDTALVLQTRRALRLIDADLERLVGSLAALARTHEETPMLARTLMQPAQVTSFGLVVLAWLAPLVRARERLARSKDEALQLQFGGAVGTLAALGDAAPGVARRLGERLELPVPAGSWHVQRDRWVGLGCELALLCGSLGKIGRDLALLGQGGSGEVTEPRAPGRGGSSAMPNKHNPVGALVAIAAATRAPAHAAALLAAMPQEHQRALGGWQAELAEWPPLVVTAQGSARALADACAAGLVVDTARLRSNIDAERGGVFAEAAAALLAPVLGKAAAQSLLSRLAGEVAGGGDPLEHRLLRELDTDPRLAGIDADRMRAAFDIDEAAARAGALALAQLDALHLPLPRTPT